MLVDVNEVLIVVHSSRTLDKNNAYRPASFFFNCSIVDLQDYISSGIQHSDSQFLNVILHYSYYKILAVFPMLYNISLQLTYFVHSSLYLLTPCPYLAPPCFPLPSGNLQFVLYIYESCFFFVIFTSLFYFLDPHVSDIIQYLSFPDLLHIV